MIRKKLWLIAVTLFVVVLLAAGAYIGDYFVKFALQRGTAADSMAAPAACADILDPSVEAPARPDYPDETWKLTSFDGLQLTATHFSPRIDSHKWAVVVHGYGRSQENVWFISQSYLAQGYHVLTPDLRASGKSEGKYLTMGTLESRDIGGWLRQIAAQDPASKIVLHGVSMGAATVMLASAQEQPENLVAVVEDCGYSSVYQMFSLQLKQLFNLPAFPIMDCVNIMSRIKTGVWMTDAAPLRAVPYTKVPMLFIHGDADKLVPMAMEQELFQASGAPAKDELIVHGAGHAAADQVAHQAYYDKIFNFIGKYME